MQRSVRALPRRKEGVGGSEAAGEQGKDGSFNARIGPAKSDAGANPGHHPGT